MYVIIFVCVFTQMIKQKTVMIINIKIIIKSLVLLTQTKCVHCAVRAGI